MNKLAKKSKKKGRSPYIGVIIFVLAAVAAGIIVLKYLESQKYEKELLKKSEEVNLKLESSLFKAGLSKKEIVSSSEELKSLKNGKVLLCKRVITLKKGVKIEDIAKAIRGLSELRGVDVEETRDEGIIKKQGRKYVVRLSGFIIQEIVIYPSAGEEEIYKPLPPEISKKKPMVALIIDDLGGSLKQANVFLKIDGPIIFSILPNLAFSKKISRLANDSGKEVILHCPMEPEDYPKDDPGKGGIFSTMEKDEILKILDKDLESVPNAVGFNNHMGSKLTQDREKMKIILGWAKRKKLFFIDSRTTAETKGAEVARELDVKFGERLVFLDNIREVPEIEKELSRLLSLAKKNGKAIGIGHPYPETAVAIQMMLPEFEKEGVELATASSVVE